MLFCIDNSISDKMCGLELTGTSAGTSHYRHIKVGQIVRIDVDTRSRFEDWPIEFQDIFPHGVFCGRTPTVIVRVWKSAKTPCAPIDDLRVRKRNNNNVIR